DLLVVNAHLEYRDELWPSFRVNRREGSLGSPNSVCQQSLGQVLVEVLHGGVVPHPGESGEHHRSALTVVARKRVVPCHQSSVVVLYFATYFTLKHRDEAANHTDLPMTVFRVLPIDTQRRVRIVKQLQEVSRHLVL